MMGWLRFFSAVYLWTVFICISASFSVSAAEASLKNGAQDYQRKFPAMALTNWQDSTILWNGARLNSVQRRPSGPAGIVGYRISKDWTKSGVSTDSFALSWGGMLYPKPELWDGDAMLTPDGEWRQEIELYNGASLPFRGRKSIFFPPGERFYVVQYHFENPSTSAAQLRLLDYVNTIPCTGELQWGWYDPNSQLLMSDETKCNQFYFATAPFVPDYSSFAVGSPISFGIAAAPVEQFAARQTLSGTRVEQSAAIQVGAVYNATVGAGQSVDYYMFRTLQADYQTAVSVAKRARSRSAADWIQQTSASYRGWLARGQKPSGLSPDMQQFYFNSLLVMKNSQNPTLGTFVASFHPAYQYKVWGRDAAFNAMVMDAAGYHDEAAAYYKWMASAQLSNTGAFHTCYDWWTGVPVGFVEPQFDSAGAFLMGAYYHAVTTRDTQFLNAIRNKITDIENFFLSPSNIGFGGFAPADYSIWEESSDGRTGEPLPPAYFTFTQSMAVAGLWCASQVESLLSGGSNSPSTLINRANQIQDAIETRLWVESPHGYYARSIWSDTNQIDLRADSSSVAFLFTGSCANSSRALSHLAWITKNLTRLDAGIARYHDDPFFYDSIYNPGGGPEVGAPSPPWGVVTMFTAWAELAFSKDISARLQWMHDHAAPGGMPVGEAIDGVSGEFVMSSAPDIYEHAAVFVWAELQNAKLALSANVRTWPAPPKLY